ncbi:kinesin-domain-containing protein [Tuber magnatum]|uniref:Kinesin-like protein n=1 Tax=Tuber magnatum TaxID=42249 RepID=A0A317SSX0_9PEZI|nr:kinesin-domain-containing protein [Tuber magnatum]
MSKGSAIPTGARPASAQGFRHPGGGESALENGAKSVVKRKQTDIKGRLEDTEAAIAEMREIQAQERIETMALKEQLEDHKLRAYQLETTRVTLETQNTQAQFELESYQKKTTELERILGDERRARAAERDDASKRLRDETDEIRRRLRDEMDGIIRSHREALETMERRARNDLEDEKSARAREIQELKMQAAMERQRMELEMDGSGRDLRALKAELETTRMELGSARNELQREKAMSASLRDSLSEQSGATLTLESSSRALRARVEALESDGRAQANSYAELEEKLQQSSEETRVAQEKLRAEETLRRKLHNQVQELKGNIRVFCRVRPTLPFESETPADIRFPNAAHNPDVFEEISQLVQSALDGYNVCIFCYGQTGSGKTYTMSSEDGMIPRAVHQIYATAKGLEEKGWIYKMEGSFVEVYNENINDLLGQADDFDKKKHEIRHDPRELKTTITDINTVTLDNPAKVESILRRASQTRSVAATKANERSSRSHSVFILKLIGLNSVTGERSEGTLNLVDLAGSERLSHSQSTGERLKETQNINRSLSCLGDVIAALGNGKENSHIPYRNSKLTYLLQYSLGGNSKCLMFVMVSPMQAHLNETLTSLKFATKVNNTSIGTAKRQAKVTG